MQCRGNSPCCGWREARRRGLIRGRVEADERFRAAMRMAGTAGRAATVAARGRAATRRDEEAIAERIFVRITEKGVCV